MPAPSDVQAKLEASRQELLDLGLRNPLLNYKPPRARGVVVVDERPDQIFKLLVTEGKAVSFLPATAEQAAEGLLGQPPEPRELAKGKALPRHVDTRLQTGLASAALQTALLNTHRAARAFIEEQGANVLYFALGALEWLEPGNKADVRRAPLILVPVELTRASAQARFQARYTGEELGENLSLAARLKADHGVVLPALPAPEDLEVGAYFDQVAQAVAEQGWKLDREAVALGFFAFGKFLMYRDLDPQTWPAEAAPQGHPVLQALLGLGFAEPPAPIAEDAPLDEALPPGEPPNVVDMDGSQALAVASARAGRNIVIQGPPGTGKSQTITNLIADALARGQTVLFVAEKLAALEVVKRRLDAVGLGDACLELHSHKASRKAVLSELQRTLALGRPRTSPDHADDLAVYGEVRERLNDVCAAMNQPVGETGVSPYQALGHLATRRAAAAPPVVPGMAGWSAVAWKRRLALVEQLEAVAGRLGTPAAHPFYGAGLREWRPTLAAALREAIARARTATTKLAEAATALAPAMAAAMPAEGSRAARGAAQPAGVPQDAAEAGRLFAGLRRLADPPPLAGLTLDAPEWLQRWDDLRRLTAAGGRLAVLRRTVDPVVTEDAWEENLLETRLHLAAHGRKLLRHLNADYRRARARLAAVCRGKPPAGLEARLALIDALSEGARHRSLVRDLQGLGEAAFWPHWAGMDSDWEKLAAATAWLHDLNEDLAGGQLDAALPAAIAAHPDGLPVPAGLADAEAALDEHARAWRAVAEALAHRLPLAGWPFAAQLEALATWERELERLGELVSYNQLAAKLEDEGLGPVVALGSQGGRGLADALRHAWAEAVLERALTDRPELATFSGAAQEIDVQRFRELDVAIAAYNRATLALRHWEALPRLRADGGGAGQLALVQREMEKRARWLPIRQLLARAGNAVQHIKPVFMMSPLSIATFLAPEAAGFDLVVFDEASQVKPVDAFGAILRAKQVVVVGDKKQMPPTSFFDTQFAGDDDAASETQDFESVLGLMEAQGAPQHMLRWHYRSRHESLIAISNQAFYDGRLVVFPSPDAGREEAGLRLHHLPDAVYERGSSRTNPAEARAVAEAVMAHARTRPQLSLGVAAFSMAQMQAIEAEVERLRREDPSLEPFFAAHPHEPFFVKNLETVQGDERDVMVLSTAYGRDAEGKLTMNFGPLNLEGGQRRLNVLITRARLRCEVFTSLKAEDLPADGPPGVAALKLFLAYAGTPAASLEGSSGVDGVEEAIAREVAALGYEVERHVGASNFFLDLAVRDTRRPGRFLLAIALDGPNYASATSARDRDRLRAQVLEGLGWQVHRIWALDWLNRPEAERKRLAEALEAAASQAPPAPEAPEPLPAIERSAEEAPATSRPTAYVFAAPEVPPAAELPALPTNHLARLVGEVVAVESPVHAGEVVRRLAAAAGSKRPPARLVKALEGAVAHAVKSGGVRQAGDFLWHPEMDVAPVRDRGAIPAAQRKLELICPEERQRAVEKAVADACGLARADVALAAGKLLGYYRPNEEVRTGLEAAVEAALAAGRIVPQGDQVILAD